MEKVIMIKVEITEVEIKRMIQWKKELVLWKDRWDW
jgi:hypothetical protein